MQYVPCMCASFFLHSRMSDTHTHIHTHTQSKTSEQLQANVEQLMAESLKGSNTDKEVRKASHKDVTHNELEHFWLLYIRTLCVRMY
jgi:hypothetical protein